MQVSGRCRVITEDGSYFNGELKPGEKLSSAQFVKPNQMKKK
jgi:hypothetical protein